MDIKQLYQYYGGADEKTPDRFLKAMDEIMTSDEDLNSIYQNAIFRDEEEYTSNKTQVTVRDIPFFSMCNHHMLPFWGLADISYVPNGAVIGLSKLTRIVRHFSARFQLQEKLTQQICESIFQSTLLPEAVYVRLRGKHLCQMSRGARNPLGHMQTEFFSGNNEWQEILKNLPESAYIIDDF